MNHDSILKNQLTILLKGGGAHLSAARILEKVDPVLRTKKPSENIKSIWEELEHLRLSQKDILDYMTRQDYRSMNWPEDYWPKRNEVSDEQWKSSENIFLEELNSAIEMLEDENFDLFETVPQSDEHTNLREILLIADHNAYHLSKIVQLRKIFGDW